MVGTASLGPALCAATPVPGLRMPVSDEGGGPGCTPFSNVDTKAVGGRIALIDRGTCAFTIKV